MSDEEDLELEDEAGESAEESDPLAVTFTDDEFGDIFTSSAEPPTETYCEFVSGAAGVGKTWTILDRCKQDPLYAVMTASTGVAAVNLSATTINSLLGFFDLDSLRDAHIRGSAAKRLRDLVDEGYKNVVLDEISMVSHQMLDILIHIFDGVNQSLRPGQSPIGLVLSGDFCQLSPVPEERGKNRGPAPYAFEAQCWPRFESNTIRLTEPHRQSDLRFLSALHAARRGDGAEAVRELVAANLPFHSANDLDFDGTTLLAENKQVDAFNTEAMKKVKGRDMFLPTRRWGKQRGEWKHIPEKETKVRDNAYVMILANKSSGRNNFEYVNGDCGHIRGITTRQGMMPLINVELIRTGEIVKVGPIIRGVSYKDKPSDFHSDEKLGEKGGESVYFPKLHYSRSDRRYVVGQIQYYPIRLAFATTVHKSQGLGLDRVQVDMRTWQFSNPGMAYIALSRCRTLEGLRVVGQPELVAARMNIDPRVAPWL